MAASAFFSSVSTSGPSCGYRLIPALAVTSSSCPSISIGSATAADDALHGAVDDLPARLVVEDQDELVAARRARIAVADRLEQTLGDLLAAAVAVLCPRLSLRT